MFSNPLLLAYGKEKLRDSTILYSVGGSLALVTAAFFLAPRRQLGKQGTSHGHCLYHGSPPPPSSLKTITTSQKSPCRSSFERFLFLLRIAIPSLRSKEAGITVLLNVLLLLRLRVSLNMVRLSGILGRVGIQGDMRAVARMVMVYLFSCFPAAVLDNTVKYLIQILEMRIRFNLTQYMHSRYLCRGTFLNVARLSDTPAVDQILTEDIRHLSHLLALPFATFSRPLSELVVFSHSLAQMVGWQGPLLTLAFYTAAASFAGGLLPNFDLLASQRMEREGAFRAAYQEVMNYTEEHCTVEGQGRAKEMLDKRLAAVTDLAQHEIFLRCRFNLCERVICKCSPIILGFVVGALSLGDCATEGMSVADLASRFSAISYMHHAMCRALGGMLWNSKLVLAINSSTQRMYQLVEAVKRAEHDLAPADTQCLSSGNSDTAGEVMRGEHIEFIDVPLATPNGDVLHPSLSFFVKPGMNVMVVGPNGCGKSSTFRLLGGLWPLRGGRIVKPPREDIHYVPQHPYMCAGTLLEQLIYPHLKKNLVVSESELYCYMEMAGLGDFLSRPNVSLDARLSWTGSTVSLGERQRLAIARLFYHRPRFAFLEECSSHMDEAAEKAIYSGCRQLGISLISIAHRRRVWQYHNWMLYFDGGGRYIFSPFCMGDSSSTLILSKVVFSSDPTLLGKEVQLVSSDYDVKVEVGLKDKQ